MAWFKVDDNFYDHPKVDELSLEAVGVWLLCGTYSARHLTDGYIPVRRAYRMGADENVIQELTEAELWHEVEGGYQFHNWSEYQPTKDSVEEARKKERDRKREYRRNKQGQYTGQQEDVPEVSQRDSTRDSQRPSDQPDPTRPDPTSLSKDRDTSDSADAEPRPDIESVLDRIDQHCEAHDFKKPNRTKANINAARLMLDKDERTLDQVNWIMDWVTSHHFWAPNIRSAAKLREQFDQLKGQALANRQPQPHMTASQRRLQEGYEREQRILNGELSFDNTDNPYLQPRPTRAIEGGHA